MEEGDDIIYGIDAPARNIPELAVATLSIISNLKEQKGSKNIKEQEQEESCFSKHLETYVKKHPISSVSFKNIDLEWFNVSEPLSFEDDLQSHVVVLDFFTYCCINCLHILPDLEEIEETYKPNESPVLVIGIHSAKFDNERLTKNVSDAVMKNHISHPVASDIHCKLWHTLGISCWPTLLVVGPGGCPLFVFMGEGNKDILFKCIEETINFFGTIRKLDSKPLPLMPRVHLPSEESDLYYPGKVGIYPDGLIISDSGNNRIILTNCDGEVKNIIGSGKKGFQDGNFRSSSFSNPQGVAFHPSGFVFVADTDNHAIRKISLESQTVETVAGTGLQGTDKEGGCLYTEQTLSSPWDLCLGHSTDADQNSPPNLLFIAMAGLHQIWGMFLTDGHWLKNSFYPEGTIVRLAGSGLEENRNTSYPLKAGFAQPSGIATAQVPEGEVLFIADSESSSIRQLSCFDGSVRKVAGGGVDPKDLFAYGDQDGTSNEVKFQHPLGVATFMDRVYVADSYNHKIKMLRRRGKSFDSQTVLGYGRSQETQDVLTLNEPGGLCVSEDGKFLFIADTNNFTVKEYNTEDGNTRELRLSFPNRVEINRQTDTTDSRESISVFLPPKEVRVNIILKLQLPPNVRLNSEAKNKYSIICSGDVQGGQLSGSVDLLTSIPLAVNLSSKESADITVSFKVYLCLDNGICVAKELSKVINFLMDENEAKDEQTVILQMKPEL